MVCSPYTCTWTVWNRIQTKFNYISSVYSTCVKNFPSTYITLGLPVVAIVELLGSRTVVREGEGSARLSFSMLGSLSEQVTIHIQAVNIDAEGIVLLCVHVLHVIVMVVHYQRER